MIASSCSLWCGLRVAQQTLRGAQKFNAFFNELASGGIPDGYKDVMTDMAIGLAVPLVPDDEGATVYDFGFNKTSCHWES